MASVRLPDERLRVASRRATVPRGVSVLAEHQSSATAAWLRRDVRDDRRNCEGFRHHLNTKIQNLRECSVQSACSRILITHINQHSVFYPWQSHKSNIPVVKKSQIPSRFDPVTLEQGDNNPSAVLFVRACLVTCLSSLGLFFNRL